MTISLFDSIRQKQLWKKYLIFFSAVVIFSSLVYYPIYIHLNANILWSGSLLLFFWMEIVEPLVYYLTFWGSFAFLLYSASRYSLRGSTRILIVYALGTVLRYALQNVVFIFIMGLNEWEIVFHPLDVLFNIILDLFIMGAAVLAVSLWKKRTSHECFPISKFFDLKNSMLKTALIISLFPTVLRLLSRLLYDIDLIFLKGIPVAGVGEALLIMTYYIAEGISFLVGYLVIFMLLSSFYLSDERARLKFENEF